MRNLSRSVLELPYISHITHAEAVRSAYAAEEAHERVENIAPRHALRFGNSL